MVGAIHELPLPFVHRIALSAGLLYSGLSFTQSGNNALIKVTANNENLALLTGIQESTLTASDFITY